MQTLLLIRHAKAAFHGAVPGDHSRPLAEKGHRQMARLTEQIAAAGIKIDLALVSTAQRTLETWDRLKSNHPSAQLQEIERLYLASADEIDRQIWLFAEEADTLAVIGHNPGLAILAWNLLEAGRDHDPAAEQMLRGNFKTGYAARFDMTGSRPKLVRLMDPRTT